MGSGEIVDTQTDKKVTIDEVAKLCGVSKTTISRYLNGKYENISAQTRERIREVIKQLGYRPNKTAQRLKANRTMLIGCVIGDISSPFSALLFSGMTRVCDEAGYQILFANSGEDPVRERRAIDGFLESRVDGLIINTCGGNDGYLTELHDSGINIVLADRGLAQPGIIDTVTTPNSETAFDCVRFLRDCGYTRIAFFSEGIHRVSPRVLRHEGYEKAIAELFPKGTLPATYEFDKNNSSDCLECISSFRSKYPEERIAILAVNGVTAQRVLRAMNTAGIRPGYDYGLCSFDDWSWLQIFPDGVTSVKQPTEEIGAQSARLLIERMTGQRDEHCAPVSITLPASIKARGSTKSET